MPLSRRAVVFGIPATLLAACAGGPAPTGQTMRAVANPAYDQWVAAFRSRAGANGIAPETMQRAFRGSGYLPGVIEHDRNQTEFVRSTEDYLAIAASDDKVSQGRKMLTRHGSVLSRIKAQYGVEPQVVAAIWGVESRYGTRRGDIPVISSQSTLAFDGRRGAFFERQLVAALRILQAGDVTPGRMTGSWAGAMGHTQFIPTSYLAYAVDFTGDGRRDIWSDDPTDALASTAAYLARSGWQQGRPWGIEVRVPTGFDPGLAGRGTRHPVSFWTANGVRDMDGRMVPDHGAASVILPAGATGPAFMTFANFNAIARYNNAQNYVIGVGHLSDRLAGGPPVRGVFPPDAQGLSLKERQEVQRRLTAKGFDTKGDDGVIGPNTIAAINAYQRRQSLPVTGLATPDLLRRLQS